MEERKFTDEEIIKALECCASADCVNCPRWSEEWYSGMCADFLPSVLDLVKRPKWISVEERLPDRNGRYLTHCKIAGQSLVCILYYCKVGGFNEETVTHWMPLPEPPKGE